MISGRSNTDNTPGGAATTAGMALIARIAVMPNPPARLSPLGVGELDLALQPRVALDDDAVGVVAMRSGPIRGQVVGGRG